MLNELRCNVGQMNSKHFDTGRALGQISASVSMFGNQSGLGRFPVKSALGQIGPKSKRPHNESQIGHIFQIE